MLTASRRLLCAASITICIVSSPDIGNAEPVPDADMLMVVDCLLPNQIRRLGSMTYAAARQAIKTSAAQCEARGGEYVLFDRASRATTLKVWMPLAEQGDPEAQTYVGETFERGHGAEPDYASAAEWYLRAAEQGHSRAAINLANLFEQGHGLDPDPDMARFWYQAASEFARPEAASTEVPTATFTIIEPQLNQRGIAISAKAETDPNAPLLVIGQIETDSTVAYISINETRATLAGGTLFRAAIPSQPDGSVVIRAHLTTGEQVEHRFSTSADNAPELPAIDEIGSDQASQTGEYHALLIGNNEYHALPDLDTAVPDVEQLAQLLQRDYGFEVSRLIDADRYEILTALNGLSQRLNPDDRLLIYYAGHGELDRTNQRGHWLPVDAEAENTANWISNIAVTDLLNIMSSRQLLVVADSCYSGMMSRTAIGVPRSVDGRTRTVMTSGGVAPVLDAGGGEHSVFARELISALAANQGDVTASEIHAVIAPRVTRVASRLGFEQQPEYAPLKFAGHEGGDFVFSRRNDRGN